MEFKEYRMTEKRFDVPARLFADRLQGRASLANEDPFLRLPLDRYFGADEVLFLFPFVERNDIDRCRIRDILRELVEDCFLLIISPTKNFSGAALTTSAG